MGTAVTSTSVGVGLLREQAPAAAAPVVPVPEADHWLVPSALRARTCTWCSVPAVSLSMVAVVEVLSGSAGFHSVQLVSAVRR